MPKYAVLLRGVNVGKNAQLPMADLRRVLESLGHTDVSTYLRSGNAVVTSPDKDPARLAAAIRAKLAADAGMDVAVLLRTNAELAAVIAANPYPQVAADEPAKLHVAFLSGKPTKADLAKLGPDRYAPDEFRLGDRALYIWFVNGAGRSKLGGALGRLTVDATARNWNTVLKLAELTAS